MSNNDNLVEIEKELLLKINKRKSILKKLIKKESLIAEKKQEEKELNKNIKLLENIIAEESGEIVNIRKSISIKNKENLLVKDKFENFRIEFEINKKQIDEETIRKEKIEEEINVTQKQIKNTQNILLALNGDTKKADYEENILLSKPNDSEIKIKDLKANIELNEIKLKKLEEFIYEKKSELESLLHKHENTKN